MNRFFCFFIFILQTVFSFSQVISGRVEDEHHQAVSLANVFLLSKKDSSFVKGTVSAEDGSFSLQTSLENCLLKVSAIGYKTVIEEAKQGDAGVIVLKENTLMLGSVIVKGNLPKHQLTKEGMKTLVTGSVLEKIGTANEVLEKIPMVTVNSNGEIQVFGKGTPIIYINNRKVMDNSELEHLSSENIQSVEVINHPGAGYDATVGAVIRIKTKKRDQGLGFSFASQNKYDYYFSENQRAEINYQKKGLNIFGMLSAGTGKRRSTIYSDQTNFADTVWNLKSTSKSYHRLSNLQGKVGFGYDVSPHHSFGAYYQYSEDKDKEYDHFVSDVFSNGTFYDSWNSSGTTQEEKRPGHEANIYYNGTFGKFSMNWNMDYVYSKDNKDQIQRELSQNYTDRTVITHNTSQSRLGAVKAELSYRLSPSGTVSLGEEYTNTNRKNQFNNIEGVFSDSNNKMQEKNSALFLQYSQKWNKIQLNAGMRYEHVSTVYTLNGKRQDDQSRKYDNLFPDLSVSFPIGKAEFSVGYSKKVQRPGYSQLDGNVYYLNRFHYLSGNPMLRPTYIDAVTANVSYSWLFFTASLSHDKDVIVYSSNYDQQDPKIAFVTFENASHLNRLSCYASLSPTVGWWHPAWNVGMNQQWFKYSYCQQTKSFNKPILFFQWYNAFNLPYHYQLRIDGSYQGSGNNQNMKLDDLWNIDASAGKSFFNDRLSLRIAVHDIFNMYKFKPQMYNHNLLILQQNVTDTRYVTFTLHYNLNISGKKYKGMGAGNSEKNRL